MRARGSLTIQDAVAVLIKHVQLLLDLLGHTQVCMVGKGSMAVSVSTWHLAAVMPINRLRPC